MRNNQAILITEYADTNLTIQKQQTTIWCEIKSVTRSEYYSAYAAGLSPKYIIDIDPMDYSASKVTTSTGTTFPNKVSIDSVEYLIVRAFKKNMQNMELTVG